MTKYRVAILVVCAVALFGEGARVSAQVPPTLFDMHITGGAVNGEPWPVDGFAGVSLWDSAIPWTVLNPAPGVYNWRFLDIWMNHAAANKVDLLYTFGDTPQWASSNPNDLYCADTPPYPPGTCDPPNDLNADGSGTNEHFKQFVTAIATHARGRIHYWEIWDEANNNGEVNGKRVLGQGRWVGTIAQLIRMAEDARRIILSVDPTAVILSASGGIETSSNLSWFNQYFGKGGGKYADAITFHGYVQGYTQGLPVPESLIPMLDAAGRFRSILTKYGLNNKALFDTEASWGVSQNTGLTDPDMQAGFVVRFYLVHQSENIARFYWYEWDNLQAGTLWSYNNQGDLAVADGGGNNLNVLLGYGDGTFEPPLNTGAGSTPTAVAVADFNGDGIADAALANAGNGTVSVFLGNGNNTFGSAKNSNAGNSPAAVATADFNRDGAADLAVANGGSTTVSILLGNGNGTFKSPVPQTVGTNPTSVATGVFTSNGYASVAVANGGSNNVSVLLGNGDGTFQTAHNYPVGTTPNSVATGILTGGKVSLVVANAGSNNISVLLGNGDGTFQAAVPYSVATSPTSVTVGDFNNDGNMDIAVANGGSNNVSVLLGNGDGTFKGAVNFNVGSVPYSIVAQDLNWDGCLDLIVANQNSNNVSVLLGNCKGGFSSTPLNSAAGTSPVALAVGYFNTYGNNFPGTLMKPGVAYQQAYNWMVGNTMSTCTSSGTIWTCDFTGSNGYEAQAVWDASQSCSHGVCTTSNYTFDPKYIQYMTVYGQLVPVNGSTVPIGYQPILLQNQTPARATATDR
jgi:FG-GAP-like repeat